MVFVKVAPLEQSQSKAALIVGDDGETVLGQPLINRCALHAVTLVVAAVIGERMQPNDHRHGRRRSVFEIKITAHTMAKVDWYPVYAPGRPAVVRHQTRLGISEKLRLLDRRQSLRCLAKRPFDAFDGGSVLGDGQAGCVLAAAPLFPVEVVDQLLGKLPLLGQSAAESQVDPIEITLPISPADLFRRRAG